MSRPNAIHRGSRSTEVLLVEDCPADAQWIKDVLGRSKTTTTRVVQDSTQAMAFLERVGCYANAHRPDLIAVGLNLPKMDGWQLLEQAKVHDQLKRIPVIVLTTSGRDEDIQHDRPMDLQESFS